MKHQSSEDDHTFRSRLESCELPPAEFGHRAHVRLAYIYLTAHDTDGASARMRDSIREFIRCNGADPSKYHETITRAWIMAVRHFMEISPACTSADEFIERNPVLLDSKIMLSHYSAELLFSDEARGQFVEPDVEEIPRYEG